MNGFRMDKTKFEATTRDAVDPMEATPCLDDSAPEERMAALEALRMTFYGQAYRTHTRLPRVLERHELPWR